MKRIEALGGSLAAISVDTVEESKALADALSLSFPLLTDPNRAVIGAYGSSDANRAIAVPAVFIVKTDRTIAFSHIGSSPRDRPTTETVIRELRGED